MDILKQCQIWNDNDEFRKIISAIEALPQEERTPELDSELARAYNNLADPGDRELFEKAIELLKPHEEYFKEDHCWNFRIAYAYYYLDQEGPALDYFERALKARPGDEDTQLMINYCIKNLSLPVFHKNFRERTEESWTAFLEGEEELRRLLDQKDHDAVGDELVARCNELLAPAFRDVSFELGFNGEKYELILTPEGDLAKLFGLVYFQRRAPREVLERWNILVGRQPSHGFCLRAFGEDLSAGDVRVWAERAEGDKVLLTLYCEKLLSLLREDEGKVWWLLSTLTDQILGELPAMKLIDGFEVVDTPKAEESISLEELPQTLEGLGLELCLDPEVFLENGYTAYQMEPDQDPEAAWRSDVFAGATRCPVLVAEYLRGESKAVDNFYGDGASAGFLCYPLDGFDGGERGKEILDFRDALEAAVLEKAGQEAVTFLGGASGLFCGYLDFIAWDLAAVLDAAREFLQNSSVEWASFHTFRRNVNTILMMDHRAEQAKQADESVK